MAKQWNTAMQNFYVCCFENQGILIQHSQHKKKDKIIITVCFNNQESQ